VLHRRPRLLAWAITAALLATAPAASSVGAEPAPDWLPELRDTSVIKGPVVVRGTILGRDGHGQPARVVLVAIPTPDVLETLEVGDRVKTVPVGKTSADDDGRFQLRVDPTARLGQFMDATGTLNFRLIAAGRDGFRPWSLARRWATSHGERRWVSVDGPEADLDVSVRLDGPVVAPAAVGTTLPARDKSCFDTVVADYGSRWDAVGETYTGPNTTMDFQYESGGSSTLGVGYSATGRYGSWEQSGKYTWSNTLTVDWPTKLQNTRYVFMTQFNYKKFEVVCSVDPSGYYVWYETRPTRFDGGAGGYHAASSPYAPHCNYYVKGATATKSSGTAIEFTNGLDISGAIGINLSTQSGFSTKVRIAWKFVNAGWLCGSNTSAPTAARIVAR
jgi:hypothetical protein